MSIESKFGIGSSGGVHFKDPREMWKLIASSTAVQNLGSSTTASTAAVSGFFTEMAIRGLADDTNWSADIYKTLLSVSSGAGLVSHVVGPTGLAGTPTTTFEITVDGALYTVPVVATTTGQRAVLGPVINELTEGGAFTTAKNYALGTISVSSDKTTDRLLNTYYANIPGWGFIRTSGTPCLVFRQSLLIRAKSSEANSTTTNQERQSAVQYRLFQ
jgi:hypothetical protein